MEEAPSERPVIEVEWLTPPVVVKVVGRAEYAVPAVVPYLQVAALSVERLRVVCVVPDDKAPDGDPDDGTGGLGEERGAGVDTDTDADWTEALPAVS